MTHVDCNCQGRRVPSSGPDDAPLLIIGMAPGAEEIEEGRPFVGRSGKLLWSSLAHFGWDRSMCRIINSICVWPEGGDGNPSPAQIAACADRFDREVRASRAKVALCLGGAAIRRLTGITRGVQRINAYLISPEECLPHRVRRPAVIGQYKTSRRCDSCKGVQPEGHVCAPCKGTGWKYQKGDDRWGSIEYAEPAVLPAPLEWVVASYHPAAVQRSGYKPTWAFMQACDKAVRAASGKLRRVTVEVVDDRPRAFREAADKGWPVAVDIETGGIGSDAIERIGLATEGEHWTSPWGHQALAAARDILGDPRTTKIAHNIGFDAPRLEMAGAPMKGPLFCTMQAANILEPDLPFGLEPTAPLYLDVQMWKHTSTDEPALYNLKDAVYEYELSRVQADHLRELDMLTLFTKTIMPGYRPLMDMTKVGIKLDTQRLGTWSQYLQAKLESQRVRWQSLAGPVPYSSPAQLKRYFYDTLKMRPKYSKYGSATTDNEAISELIAEYPQHQPILETLLGIRGTAKLISTYASAAAGDDGSVHPSFLPKGRFDDEADEARKGLTATLRLSSSPNLQNQPPEARMLYIPHRPDWSFIEADYSQIEMRISAAVSGDRALLHDLKGDVHSGTMGRLAALGVQVDRHTAKTINYALAYGAGTRKLLATLRTRGAPVNSEADVQRLIDGISAAYPDWWRWRQGIIDFVTAHRYVVNPFKYRRPLYGGRADVTKAVDTIPQSTAAVILWDRLPAMWTLAREFGGNLLLTVHDSFLLEVPTNALPGACSAVRDAMMVEFPQVAPGFRVPADIKTGTRWGAMEKWGG